MLSQGSRAGREADDPEAGLRPPGTAPTAVADHPELLVVSGPSGVGKGTLLDRLLSLDGDLCPIPQVTTRPARPGEQGGHQYRFLTEREFFALADAGKLAAYNSTFGDAFYGVEHSALQGVPAGSIGVLELDVANLLQLRRHYRVRTILILSPSAQETRRRLIQRGIHQPSEIAVRLRRGCDILAQARLYEHLIVNEDFAQALHDLAAVVAVERLRRRRPRLLKAIARQVAEIGSATAGGGRR